MLQYNHKPPKVKEIAMTHNEKTRTLILEHYKKYPMMEIADLFKFLFQSSFGCEHMVSSLEGAIEYIKRESATVSDEKADGELIDLLDGDYVRVHLGYLKHGIDADTLGKLFYLSAKTEADGKMRLKDKLGVARALVCESALPFSLEDFDGAVEKWRELGYPAIHHSDTFRREYHPAYRVIATEFIEKLPILQ